MTFAGVVYRSLLGVLGVLAVQRNMIDNPKRTRIRGNFRPKADFPLVQVIKSSLPPPDVNIDKIGKLG